MLSWQTLSREQLAACCYRANLKHSGTVAELVARLKHGKIVLPTLSSMSTLLQNYLERPGTRKGKTLSKKADKETKEKEAKSEKEDIESDEVEIDAPPSSPQPNSVHRKQNSDGPEQQLAASLQVEQDGEDDPIDLDSAGITKGEFRQAMRVLGALASPSSAPPSPPTRQQDPFASFQMSNLPKATIDKARRGEYVNLAAFLPNPVSPESLENDKVEMMDGQIVVNMNNKPKAPSRTISDFNSFVEAFLVFIKVVAADNPKALEVMSYLVQYLYNITTVAANYGFAKASEYDFKFRAGRTSFGPEWSDFNNQLFLLVVAKSGHVAPSPSQRPHSSSSSSSSSSEKNEETCLNYNNRGCFWHNCPRKHRCLRCSELHPESQCPQARAKALSGEAHHRPRRRSPHRREKRPRH
jgi:hypothetical protein